MRCRNCDYSLWNLRTRQCPECGSPFAPSDYEFVPNSVRFCCPHCDQSYFGTGPTGELMPRQFACVNCQQTIDMDEMVLRPAEGVRESETVIDPLPWLRRQTGGWFRCWWQTTWRGMIAPARLAQGIPAQATTSSAWWYLTVTLFACAVVGVTVPLVVWGAIEASTGNTANAGEMILFGVAAPFGNVIFNAILLAIWGLITHATLRLTGGCAHGLGHTMQALCYTAGPNILMAVPCVGFYCLSYVSFVWWVVCAIIMLAALQKVHGGRASLAGLVFPVGSVILIIVAYFGLIFWAMNVGMTAAARQQNMYSPHNETLLVVDALLGWADDHDGELPAHALELIEDGGVTVDDFIAIDSMTFAMDVPVGDAALDDFAMANEFAQQTMIDEMSAAQPDDIVAHRFGDFVFTYHGIDPRSIDAGLWMVLLIHDPQSNDPSDMSQTIYVGKAGRVIGQFPAWKLAEEVRRQNQRRRTAGLPPLPEDLANITHDQPAVDASGSGE